jgi:hypothetical protein
MLVKVGWILSVFGSEGLVISHVTSNEMRRSYLQELNIYNLIIKLIAYVLDFPRDESNEHN